MTHTTTNPTEIASLKSAVVAHEKYTYFDLSASLFVSKPGIGYYSAKKATFAAELQQAKEIVVHSGGIGARSFKKHMQQIADAGFVLSFEYYNRTVERAGDAVHEFKIAFVRNGN